MDFKEQTGSLADERGWDDRTMRLFFYLFLEEQGLECGFFEYLQACASREDELLVPDADEPTEEQPAANYPDEDPPLLDASDPTFRK